MTKSKWDELDWLEGIRRIVEWVQTREDSESVMLLLRHSHREILRDHKDMLGGGLTELGKQTSFEVGQRLPISRSAHFFFSIVPRCYETAEWMAKGFTEKGGSVIDMDPLPPLVGPEYSEQEVWGNLNPNGENVTEFVNRWAQGDFGTAIEPLEEYQARIVKETVERAESHPEPVTHVHITHDLGLMCIKRLLLGRPLEEDDREPYLGGLGVSVAEREKMLFMGGRQVPMPTETP